MISRVKTYFPRRRAFIEPVARIPPRHSIHISSATWILTVYAARGPIERADDGRSLFDDDVFFQRHRCAALQKAYRRAPRDKASD